MDELKYEIANRHEDTPSTYLRRVQWNPRDIQNGGPESHHTRGDETDSTPYQRSAFYEARYGHWFALSAKRLWER
jgi:hypothetical protein